MENFWQDKKEGFIQLGIYEDERKALTSRHRQLLYNVTSSLQSRVNLAKEAISALEKYFKHRGASEHNIVQNMKAQLVYLPNPEILKEQPSLKDSLSSYSHFQEELIQHYRITSNYINNEIINKAIPSLFLEYDSQAVDYFNKLSPLKNDVENTEAKTQKLFQDYCNLFKEMQNAVAQNQKVSKDLWLFERKYTQNAEILMHLQNTYGSGVMKLWESIQNLEERRINLIKSSFDLLLRKELKVVNLESCKQAQESFQQVEIQKEVKQTLNPATLLSTPDLTIQTFKDLILSPQLPKPPISPLIVKKGYLHLDVGKISTQWQICCVIQTKDRHLHIFAHSDEEPDDPLESFYLLESKIHVMTNNQFQIVANQSS